MCSGIRKARSVGSLRKTCTLHSCTLARGSERDMAIRTLGRTVVQARTLTHTTRKSICSFRRLASTALPDGSKPATATNRVCPFVSCSYTHTRAGAEATLTRFWKAVGLQERGDILAITLDSRPLKTPAGKPLFLPHSKRLTATLIVAEWENQRKGLKSHALPMVHHLC